MGSRRSTNGQVRPLESHVLGSWHTPLQDGVLTRHAVTGEPVATVSSGGVDFAATARYAREVGGPTRPTLPMPRERWWRLQPERWTSRP
ncbi:MAG: hypothetical protein MK184_03375 [Acidimicrobiales bacterium]|nr:hypothetical protein [Acidimicrobiales bacterium]HIM85324.1 hypothetical protein [Acidimicrobiia bacterium]